MNGKIAWRCGKAHVAVLHIHVSYKMKRSYLSGSKKRKLRKEKEAAALKNSRTLFSVGFQKVETPENHTYVDADDDNGSVGLDLDDLSNVSSDKSDSDGSETDSVTNTSSTQSPHTVTQASTCTLNGYDIGKLENTRLTDSEVKQTILSGPIYCRPKSFPKDSRNAKFPVSILTCKQQNGDCVERDWLVWSEGKMALFYRIFAGSSQTTGHLSSVAGWSTKVGWKKLWDRVPMHERSSTHRENYIRWREAESHLHNDDAQLNEGILSEKLKWREILRRIIDVILFLGERGLAFRGSTQRIGHPDNGNFLGIIELLSHYDPLLREHVTKVAESQAKGKRLAVHYLSSDSQNEFISACAYHVRQKILNELINAKYYSVIVDATPDCSHVEQTTFILRYVSLSAYGMFEVQERFLKFIDCNKKTGADIATLILDTLKDHSINVNDCRGQGYDNGSNMSGKYEGAQAHVLRVNSLAIFSPCACHSLNLCGAHAAECCPEVQTYFGIVQKLYNLFSSSPMRWEILQENIDCSLHSMSQTRWSARIDSVRPFAAHIPGIKSALLALRELNLTSETKAEVDGIHSYIHSFTCVIMSSIWIKVLAAIDLRNKVLQARSATLDIEVSNIDDLLKELMFLRQQWPSLLAEAKTVADEIGIPIAFPVKRKRKRKRFFDEKLYADDSSNNTEDTFKNEVFYVLIDAVIGGITTRFNAVKKITGTFSFLWQYLSMDENELHSSVRKFVNEYSVDVSDDLIQEMDEIKKIHRSNFGEDQLRQVQLLNCLHKYKLTTLFPNCCVALRIFCTLPVTVAEGERSFSKLSYIKNYQRSTMTQYRLTDLGTLAIESKLARQLNFDNIIDHFANLKARKAHI